MKISLYYRDERSNKEYHLMLEPKGTGWVVNYRNGKRGKSLTSGTLTQQPVSMDEAQEIYNDRLKKKRREGYTEGEDGTPYSGESNKEVSGVVPQLLNPVDEEQVEALLVNDDWCAQEKFDGRNRLLRVVPAAMRTVPGVCEVQGINKLGLVVGIPQPIHDTAMRFGPGLLAGEEIADTLHVFDLLELRGRDLRLLKYRERYLELANAFASMPSHHQQAFELVHTAWTTQDKRKMLADLRQANAEGMVFKNIQAPYIAGRPNSGGPQLKLKFYKTCSAIVSVVNAKRSVAVHVLSESGEVWPIGNVTIPANKPVPQVAAIVEIRYLYMTAYPSGSLFQPVYLGPRDDVGRAECTVKQLQYRRGEDD